MNTVMVMIREIILRFDLKPSGVGMLMIPSLFLSDEDACTSPSGGVRCAAVFLCQHLRVALKSYMLALDFELLQGGGRVIPCNTFSIYCNKTVDFSGELTIGTLKERMSRLHSAKVSVSWTYPAGGHRDDRVRRRIGE